MKSVGKNLSKFEVEARINDMIGDAGIHAKRLQSIANAALGVIASSSLIVHRMGAGLAAANHLNDKHSIKQIDRLLSNSKFDLKEIWQHWICYMMGQRKEVKITMDWTDFDHDKQSTIMLNLVTSHGRATPLLWKTVDKDTLKGNRNKYEKEILLQLKQLLPTEIKATIIADRGFGYIELLKHLENLEFGYMIRFRKNFTIRAKDGTTKTANEWLDDSGKTKTLRKVHLTKKLQAVATVVCTKDKAMKDAWFIACSEPEAVGSAIVNWYAKRWGCETQFRDTKDLHFGMGLSSTSIKSTSRRDKLLFIAALAIVLLTLLGAAGEKVGLDRMLKANTVKHRTMSLFRQGCRYYCKLAHPEFREKHKELMQAFYQVLNDHKELVDILGAI